MKNGLVYLAIILAVISLVTLISDLGTPTVPFLFLVAAVLVGYFGDHRNN